LRVALLWTEGNWQFDGKAHLDEPIRVKINSANLLKETAQRMPLKFVSSRFLNPKEVITRTSLPPDVNTFTPSESFLLSRLDVPTRLEELVALSGLRELDAYRVIYGLALSGLVQREYWHNAFRSVGPKQVQVPAAVEVPIEKTQPEEPAVDEEEELKLFLERLSKAADYYEVLDLPPTAEVTEVKETYYKLARRYPPDRFHFQSGTQLHASISSAFAQVTQAYETLTDQKRRSTYDATLKRTQKFAEAASKARKESKVGKTSQTGTPDRNAGAAEEHFHDGMSDAFGAR
jgi:hypothetical protein